MANIKSFPNNQDEYIGAEYVMKWLHGRTSGVFAADNNAAVSAVQNAMAVAVSDGVGWIANVARDGVVWWNDSETTSGAKLQLPIDAADGTLNRIDRVIVEWKTTDYIDYPEIKVLKGTASINPVAPELTNSSTVRQISLARIDIAAGTTAITASMITDERLDASVCGLVTESVAIDTSVMQAQWESIYTEFLAYLVKQKAAWDAFFQNVQNDIVLPVPTADDANKAVAVNESCDGFTIKEDYKVTTATIGTDWDGSDAPYTQTVPVDGILSTDTPHITLVYSGDLETMIAQMESWGMISIGETVDGAIVFTCFEDKPEIELNIQIEVNR